MSTSRPPLRPSDADSRADGQSNPQQTPAQNPPETLAGVGTTSKDNALQTATSEPLARWPVPDDAALDAARKQITELYLGDLDRPAADVPNSSIEGNKSPEEVAREQARQRKTQLAAKLLSAAIDTPGDPPARFVLCDISAELAAQVGDCRAAWKALAEMGRSFEIDLLPKKELAAKLASNWATSATQHKGVARYWLALVVDAVNRDMYDQAQTFLANAIREADFAPDKLSQRILQESALQLREMSAAYDRAHAFEEKLSLNSQDSEAAQQWGRYLCLYKNNWADGLPLWADPSNQGPSKIAHDDAQSPAEPGGQIGLAIAWLEAAREERDNLPRRAMSLRAALWYSRAIGKLPAYLQPATAARVQEIVNQLSPLRAPDTLDLLATIEPEADAIGGAWRQAGGALVADHESGRLAIPVAISHDGSYELELEFTHRGNSFHGGEFLVFPTGDADWSIFLQSRDALTPSGAALRAHYHGSGADGGGSAPLTELLPNRRHKFKVVVELIANQTAKIRCELDGKACFDGQEPLPKLSFAESSRLQEGAIVLCTSVDHPSDSTVYHAIHLRLNSGSARPLSNVAAFKLGLAEAGGTKRQSALRSTADQQSTPETSTDADLFDPLSGIQAPSFSFMPIELDEPLR